MSAGNRVGTAQDMRLIALAILLTVPQAAGAQGGGAPSPATATAADPAALLREAEALMLRDATAAAALVVRARDLQMVRAGPASREVAEADYRLALVRALGGDRAGQLRPMAEAAQRYAALAETPEQRTLAAQLLLVVASFTNAGSERALTEVMMRDGQVLLARPDLADNAELAEAQRVLGEVHAAQGRYGDALVWAERAIAGFRHHAPDSPLLVYALSRRGSALQAVSRYGEALEALHEAVAAADRGGGRDPTVQMSALRSLGNYYRAVDRPDLALPALKRALAEASRLPPGFPYAGGLSRDIMNTLLEAGRPQEARLYAEETARRTRATLGENSYEHASALLVLARIDREAGRFDSADALIGRADAIFATGVATNNSRRFEALAARAALQAALGRAQEAAALYGRAAALLEQRPADDGDRIDLAEGRAAALLAAEDRSAATWQAARLAAQGLTTRIVRQAEGTATIDAARRRSDRVYATALDAAWARREAGRH